jgi:hypothetical protein
MTNGALEKAKTGLTKFNSNDEGGPILLGHLTEAPGTIAVLGFAGSIVAAVLGGVPLGLAALMITAHDTWAASTTNKNTVDAKAEEVPEVEEVQTIEVSQVQEFDREPVMAAPRFEYADPSRVITTPPPARESRPIITPSPEPIASDPWEVPEERELVPVGQSPSVTQLRSALEASVKPIIEPEPIYAPPIDPPTVYQEPPVVIDSNPSPMFIDSWSDRIQNSLFVGKGGSGKGYLVSNVLRGVLRKRPDLRVLVIDPKADPREQGYWQDPEFGDRVELYAKPILGSNCEDVYDWVEAGVARFNMMPAPKLLILDECTAVSGQIKSCDKGAQKLIKFWTRINSWASLGDGPGYYTWLIAQNGHLGDFGASGGVLGQFFRVAIVRGDDLAYAKTLQAGGLFNGLMPRDDRELNRLCQTSKCNRAIYDAAENKWRPMPLLTNHSDYDRDRRVSLGKNEVKPLPVVCEEPATPSLDLDAALSFLDDDVADDPEVTTDFIDGVIAKAAASNDKHKMFGELLVEVKALGNGSTLVTSAFMKEPSVAAWIAKWSRSTRDRAAILTSKSQKTVSSLLDQLTTDNFNLLEKVDDNTYKVTLH